MLPKTTRLLLKGLMALSIVAVAMLAMYLLERSSIGIWLEQRTYDLRFRVRGPLPPPADAPISILAIDEESFARNPKPFLIWQRELGEIVAALGQSGAAVVGVDLVLPDISALDPEAQQTLLSALLETARSGVPVILSYRVRSHDIERPPAVLAMAAGSEAFAFVNLTTDSDDFVRRQELFSTGSDGRAAPGFAFAIAQAYCKQRQRELAPLPAQNSTILINFRGVDAFSREPFWKALEAARRTDQFFLREKFRDRIVLIGVVAEEDLHSTPLYYWGGRSADRPALRTPGVEVHANTIATLLEGAFIRRISPALHVLITVALLVLVTVSCLLLAPWTALGVSLLATALYAGTAFYVAFPRGWWVALVAPVIGAALSAGLAETANFVLEGREKRRLRHIFQRYVDDGVIARILETPENLSLQGEKKTVSVLFSDIRDFTTLSETLAPDVLVSHLNRYFSAMVEAVQKQHGMVDKFIGDGLLAVFGAPLPVSNSAQGAVEAARSMILQLQAVNAEFAREGIGPIRIGIGIHTGEALVGNIGSHRKMEYTVIGDVVNTASRIEGLNKTHNAHRSGILISGDTLAALDGLVPVEFIGEELMKGKTRKVAVYQVSGK